MEEAARMEEGGGVSIGDLSTTDPTTGAVTSGDAAFSAVYAKNALGDLAGNSLEVTLGSKNVFDIEYSNREPGNANTSVEILYNGSSIISE